MNYRVVTGGAQGLGSRDEQQDCFAFTDGCREDFVRHAGLLAVVADGMGGHSFGKEASEIAVRAFLHDYEAKPGYLSIADALLHALTVANRAVLKFAKAHGELENCGTTLVAVVVHPQSNTLHWINVGDSRLYLIREGQCIQLTTDGNNASSVARKIARGSLTRADLRAESSMDALTIILGLQRLAEVDRSLRPFAAQAGDWLVLCSDGLYNALTARDWATCLRREPQETSELLAQAVMEKKLEHQDNATVAIMALLEVEDQAGSESGAAVDSSTTGGWFTPSLHRLWPLLALAGAGLLAALVWAWLTEGFRESVF